MIRVNPFVSLLTLVACTSSQRAAPTSETTARTIPSLANVVPVSEVEWEPLNPARGDASPMAANLWGDRNASGPTGFLVRFEDGFESPPHIHNVSYRGVVIRGLIHNDDESAAEMWMPRGSFWTQPKGGAHITAARGRDNLAYIEIDEGPYLVNSVEQAFQTEERPVNVDVSNIAWVAPVSGGFRSGPGDGPTVGNEPLVAFLWGRPQDIHPSGMFVRLAAESEGTLNSARSRLRAVVIQGRPAVRQASGNHLVLDPGSRLDSAPGGSTQLSCGPGEGCVLYLRAEGPLDVGELIVPVAG